MAEYNGGFQSYPERVTKKIFFRSDDRFTKSVTVKQGQVLKALSFVESDSTGKVIAHTGLSESAIVTFKALTAGQTMILAGLTFTAGASGATVAQLTTSWSGIAAGTGFAAITSAVGGTFTAGSMTGFNTIVNSDASSVIFTSTTALSNVADLAATGTGAAPTISKVDGAASFNKIAGVLLMDVDATSADVEATVYTEASFWADALVWAVDPSKDAIVKADGSTVACTAYNTGTYGSDAASTKRLRSKFIEGSEFDPIGFLYDGEKL